MRNMKQVLCLLAAGIITLGTAAGTLADPASYDPTGAAAQAFSVSDDGTSIRTRIYPGDRIAVMNFANAFVPGGGVTVGATAQEESLCRCSTLYPVLNQQYLLDNFYDYHEELGSPMATDTLIYSEGIVICKSDSDIPKRLPKENWTAVDVITVAAPDLSPWGMKQENGEQPSVINRAALLGYHIRRAVHVLTVAASKHVDILVLGAFGCGAFINDPETVAKAYKIALQEFSGVFKHVEFAIKSGEEKTRNYRAFEKVFC